MKNEFGCFLTRVFRYILKKLKCNFLKKINSYLNAEVLNLLQEASLFPGTLRQPTPAAGSRAHFSLLYFSILLALL